MYQVRRDAEQRATLSARGAYPGDIQMLYIANAAVDDLERVSGSAGTKVIALYERYRETAQGGVPCGTRSKDSASDDYEVEFLIS